MSDLEGHEGDLQPEEEELFQQTRAAIARWAQSLDHPDHPGCSGIGAWFCDVHGACICPRDELLAERASESPVCPLHGTDGAGGLTVRRGVFASRGIDTLRLASGDQLTITETVTLS